MLAGKRVGRIKLGKTFAPLLEKKFRSRVVHFRWPGEKHWNHIIHIFHISTLGRKKQQRHCGKTFQSEVITHWYRQHWHERVDSKEICTSWNSMQALWHEFSTPREHCSSPLVNTWVVNWIVPWCNCTQLFSVKSSVTGIKKLRKIEKNSNNCFKVSWQDVFVFTEQTSAFLVYYKLMLPACHFCEKRQH